MTVYHDFSCVCMLCSISCIDRSSWDYRANGSNLEETRIAWHAQWPPRVSTKCHLWLTSHCSSQVWTEEVVWNSLRASKKVECPHGRAIQVRHTALLNSPPNHLVYCRVQIEFNESSREFKDTVQNVWGSCWMMGEGGGGRLDFCVYFGCGRVNTLMISSQPVLWKIV